MQLLQSLGSRTATPRGSSTEIFPVPTDESDAVGDDLFVQSISHIHTMQLVYNVVQALHHY